MAEKLTQEEIDERIAVLHRLRKLLEEQRDKFREYLIVLEKQQGKIEEEDGDALFAHTELEAQIVANISSLQKVIDPMQKMYSATVSSSEKKPSDAENDVMKIQTDLADLQKKVLAQNEKNRNLLKIHISRVREELNDLTMQNPYRGRRSVYAERAVAGTMITVEA